MRKNEYLTAMAQITHALSEREALMFEVILLRTVMSECEGRLEDAFDRPGKAGEVRTSILECLAASDIRMKEVI